MIAPHSTVPSADMPLADLLEAWPQTAAVFLRRRMACPGCAMTPFMTVAEAAQAYGLPPDELVADLARAAAGEAVVGPFPSPLPHARPACVD